MRGYRSCSLFCVLSGCIAVAEDTGGETSEPLLDAIRAPCEAKETTGVAATSDLEDSFARVLGSSPTSEFGAYADIVGDLNGDGCDDLAVLVLESDSSLTQITAAFVLVYRGPFASGVFDSIGDADARIQIDIGTGVPAAMPPRTAGDTNQDGRDDLWIGGRLLESPFRIADNLSRATARLVGGSPYFDVAGGFDGDKDGATDVFVVYNPQGAALHYGPFAGDIPAPIGPTDQSAYVSFAAIPDPSAVDPLAQWVGDGEGDGFTAAVVGFWNSLIPVFGWVIELEGDLRKRSFPVEAASESVVLRHALAVPDVTGDGVEDFINGSSVCDGSAVAAGSDIAACGDPLSAFPRSAADIDGDSVSELVVPGLGLVSVTTGITYPGPPSGVHYPTLHQSDLTDDGIEDLVLFGWSYSADSGLGELRIYDGSSITSAK